MELLIAHGDSSTRLDYRRLAERVSEPLDVVECGEGREALELLLAEDAPALALIEWDLPEIDGLELCRLACQFHEGTPPYIILLAGAGHTVAEGLDAGASDCVRHPVDGDELRARLDTGLRIAATLSRRAGRHGASSAALVAERSYDDTDDAAPEAACELQSVLVAE